MRTDLVAGELTLLQSGQYDEHWRLKVANGDGTLIDISDRLKEGTVHLPNPDSPIGTADLTLWRELNDDANDSLAPLVASSYNVLDDNVTYSALLHVGRGATLEIAISARGAARPADGSTSWHEVLGGFVKQPHWPNRYPGDVRIELHDRAYKLKRTFIESPQRYDSGTTIEATIQALLDDVMGAGAYTLVVDANGSPATATGSALSQDYEPEVQPLWDALQDLAKSIGWVLWYRYDASGNPQLTLTEPRRDKTVADYTFTLAQIDDVTELTVVEEDIRNVIVVRYVDADGGVQTVTGTDDTSITKYGGVRRYMRINEDSGSPIRTEAAAQALLTAAMSDLKDPDADQAIRTKGAWWPGEPSIDLYEFAANTYLYDGAQTFAGYAIDINFRQGELSSATVKARGKPSGGKGTWEGRGSKDGKPRDPVEEANAGSLSRIRFLEDTPTEGKVTAKWKRGPDVFEVWYYSKTLALPIEDTDKPYPDPDDDTPPTGALSVGTDSLVLDIPPAGSRLFLQLETRDSSGKPLKVYKYELPPKTVSTGADLPANGDLVYSALAKSFQKYGYTGTFANASASSVTWTGGTLTLTDGSTYTISGGSATGLSGGPSNASYVYFDPDVSTTALQVTNVWGDAFGDNRLLIATVWSGAVLANHSLSIGILTLDGNSINPLSITTGLIAALAITAGKISVASLSAISADLGTVTAGTIESSVAIYAENFLAALVTLTGNLTVEGEGVFQDLVRFHTSGAVQIEDGRIMELFDVTDVSRGRIQAVDATGVVGAPSGGLWIRGAILSLLTSGTDAFGIFGATPSTKQTVTGSRGGNAALASLLTALASYGWITDSST